MRLSAIALAILGLAASGAAGVAAYARLAPVDPAAWHVDPAGVTKPAAPNNWLVAEGGDAPPLRLDSDPATVAARLGAVAEATPRTRLVAGRGVFATYETRSLVFGFPDYTSVRVAPDGAGSVVTAFARARFGYSDMGVNRARLERWMAALAGP